MESLNNFSIVLVDPLREYPGVLAWYLLGSAATKTMRPDSDIDLAALPLPGVKLNRVDLVRWSGRLALQLGREIDVGIIDPTNLVYAKEALVNGKILFSADEKLTQRRASELLSLYLKFQEDRKEVLDAYRLG